MSNNKYSQLFADITPSRWKKICDECLTPDGVREYFGVDIPSNVIGYYNRKFSYKCPLQSRVKDERGNKYGKLTVIEYAGHDKYNHVLWKCQCDCGQIVFKSGVDLRQASQRGICSCKDCIKERTSKRMWKNLTGQTINLLYVKERTGTNPQGNVLYKCECLNCGNEIIVSSSALNSKTPQVSCGCVGSKGEYYINKYLNELHIKYKTQFQFPDCRNQIPLRFDFAIFDENNNIKCLIEFQGRQHYKIASDYRDSEENLALRQKRDEIKRQYCKAHNLRLIEIPYTDLYRLSPEYLESLINGT